MIISYFVIIVGIIFSWGYYFQAYNIFKKKSAKDVSLPSYAIFAVGTLIWLVYGFHINDSTIIWGFLFGVIGSWLSLGLIIFYKNKTNE